MATVLIVDDSTYFRLKLKMELENLGHQVIGEATDGKKAVMLYQQLEPDIVTMDISMPNVGGIEAVRNIMSRDPSATIIMVSAMGQKHHVLEALKLGAKHFIVKPMQEGTVKKVLDKVLN
ncbi:response regulator [Acidaminobacter sp. JC074]|uniref:response regulator n=1 Tax=Acidaminobacter sp. JC074 TaxID=2530199 RepID=UPI001F0E6AB4|nr:response regulator [Acidaminobacter sp. JC074]MCH4888118.1 response regulator [Acidaminobacter sp. JC074]